MTRLGFSRPGIARFGAAPTGARTIGADLALPRPRSGTTALGLRSGGVRGDSLKAVIRGGGAGRVRTMGPRAKDDRTVTA